MEARNQADALVYGVEKNIKEFGDKVSAAEKTRIEEAIANAKKAIEGGSLSDITAAQEELTNASHKLAEAMYAKASEPHAEAGAQGAAAGAGKKDDDVVDADFEDVKQD
ncbi:MAG: Hsp70 family protein [Syntrophales bacterium]|nr:Hsp70 family protein [Syntrophales bacterium]